MAGVTELLFGYVNLIPIFETKGNDLKHFIFQVESLSAMLTDEEAIPFFKLIKATKIRGLAFQFIKDKECNDWTALKALLLEFNTVGVVLDWQTKISGETQGNESVTEFGNKLLKIYSDSMANYNNAGNFDLDSANKSNALFLISCFRRGLKDDRIRMTLLTAQNITTLQEAITFAQNLETTLQSERDYYTLNQVTSTKFCTYCKRNNHFISECRIRPPRTDLPFRQNSMQNQQSYYNNQSNINNSNYNNFNNNANRTQRTYYSHGRNASYPPNYSQPPPNYVPRQTYQPNNNYYQLNQNNVQPYYSTGQNNRDSNRFVTPNNNSGN